MSSSDWIDIYDLFGDFTNFDTCANNIFVEDLDIGSHNNYSLLIPMDDINLDVEIDQVGHLSTKANSRKNRKSKSLNFNGSYVHNSVVDELNNSNNTVNCIAPVKNDTIDADNIFLQSFPDFIDSYIYSEFEPDEQIGSEMLMLDSNESYNLFTISPNQYEYSNPTSTTTVFDFNSSLPSSNLNIVLPTLSLESVQHSSTKVLKTSGKSKKWPKRKPGRRSRKDLSPEEMEMLMQKLARFKLNPEFQAYVDVSTSTTHFLGCDVSYRPYPGLNLKVVQQPKLINIGVSGDAFHQGRLLGNLNHVSCADQRIKYERDLTPIAMAISNIRYEENADFCYEKPYQPQWFRFEMDSTGKRINATKCGLCPYCQDMKFYDLGSSGYLGHLTTEHGIFSNSYLVPEGINCGRYNIGGSIHKAMECPQCHDIVKLACQEGKNELLSYFRHWKSTSGHLPYDSVLELAISTHALGRQTNSKRLLQYWLS